MESSFPNGFLIYDRPATRSVTPQYLVNLLIKNQTNKSKLLKQLEQLRIDIDEIKNLSLGQIYKRFECVFRNTYSLKYLGLNQNQIGMISRRIDPLQTQILAIRPNQSCDFTVNKYFYPKPLKVGKKSVLKPKIGVNNVEDIIKKDFEKKDNEKMQKSNKIKNLEFQSRRTLTGSWISPKHRLVTAKVGRPISNQGNRDELQRMTYTTNFTKFQNLEKCQGPSPIDQFQTLKQAKSYSRKLSRGILPR